MDGFRTVIESYEYSIMKVIKMVWWFNDIASYYK